MIYLYKYKNSILAKPRKYAVVLGVKYNFIDTSYIMGWIPQKLFVDRRGFQFFSPPTADLPLYAVPEGSVLGLILSCTGWGR